MEPFSEPPEPSESERADSGVPNEIDSVRTGPRALGSRWRHLAFLVRVGRLFTPIFAAIAALKLFQRRVDLGEMTMLVSALDLSVGRGLIRDRIWERASTRAFRSIIRPGDCVVDVGAHLGYFTVLASKYVGSAGSVHAFEPDPNAWGLLTANVEENGLTNVTMTPAAIGRTTGEARIRLNAAAPKSRRTVLSLDDHFASGQTVDVLKMDIDGGEIEALEGMRQVLARSSPVHLLIEHDPWQQEAAGQSIEALHETLRSLGFRPVLAIDEGRGRIEQIDWATPDLASRTVNLLLVKDDAFTPHRR